MVEYPHQRQCCDLSRCVQCLLINHYAGVGGGHMLHLSITHSLRDRHHQEERGDCYSVTRHIPVRWQSSGANNGGL